MAFDDTVLNLFTRTVEDLQKSVNLSIQESVNKNKDVLKTMQTEQQMFEGQTATEESIKPFPYAKSTINYKKRLGQPTDRITLKDTGDFYNSIEIEAKTDDFVISTQISYSIFLVEKYADILGITDTNLNTFVNNYTLPVLKQNFDDIIAKS